MRPRNCGGRLGPDKVIARRDDVISIAPCYVRRAKAYGTRTRYSL